MSKGSVLQAIRRIAGVEIIPGTLNLRLISPPELLLKSYITEEELGGSVWRDHVPTRKSVRYGEVIIEGRFRGIIFQGDEPDYSHDQAEIMSDHRLRESLGLKDRDLIEFTLVDEALNGKQ